MPLHKHEKWNQTISGLHQGARLLGAVHQLTLSPQPAYLELALTVDPRGLSTSRLPSGERVLLDFVSGSLVYMTEGQEAVSIPLNGHTQAETFSKLFGYLVNREPGGAPLPGEDLYERVSAGIAGRKGRYQRPQRVNLLDETPIEIDLHLAQDYLQSLQEVYTGIARFKARLLGMQTPLVVWPHGLDLSTLWFAGTTIDERQFHMNFGFSPRSEGIAEPYLYAYTYPYAEGEPLPSLPEGVRWYTQEWKGMVLPFDIIAAQTDPAGFVEASCLKIYNEFLEVKSEINV